MNGDQYKVVSEYDIPKFHYTDSNTRTIKIPEDQAIYIAPGRYVGLTSRGTSKSGGISLASLSAKNHEAGRWNDAKILYSNQSLNSKRDNVLTPWSGTVKFGYLYETISPSAREAKERERARRGSLAGAELRESVSTSGEKFGNGETRIWEISDHEKGESES